MYVGPNQIDVSGVPIVPVEPPGAQDFGALNMKDALF